MSGVPMSGKATVDALANEWAKLFAIYLHREGINEVIITPRDIEAIGADGQMEKCIVVQELKDGLHIKLLPVGEAIALAKQHKGGFGKS